jgi:hypothetical protein
MGFKLSQSSTSRSRLPDNLQPSPIPSTLTIVTKTLPDDLLSLLSIPPIRIKASIIPRDSDCPEGNASQQVPKATYGAESTRGPLRKNSLSPIRGAPRGGLIGMSQLIQEPGDIDPHNLRVVASPEPMKDHLLEALLTNRARLINMARNSPSPNINRDRLMPNLLEKIGFFPLVLVVPNICPPKPKVNRQSLLPLALNNLKRRVTFPEEFPSKLSRIFHEIDGTRPLPSGRVLL